MKLVRLEDARPGQHAAADVLDPSGNLLLAAGGVLTAAHLALLKSWKLTHLQVDEPSEQAAAAPVDPAKAAAIDRELDHVFGLVGDHPIMARLKRAAAEQRRRTAR